MTIGLEDFVGHLSRRRVIICGVSAELRALGSDETMIIRRHVPRPLPAWTKGPDGEWSAGIGDPAYQRDLAEHRIHFAAACIAAGLNWKTRSGAEFGLDGRDPGAWVREAVAEIRSSLTDAAIMSLLDIQDEIGGAKLLEDAAGN